MVRKCTSLSAGLCLLRAHAACFKTSLRGLSRLLDLTVSVGSDVVSIIGVYSVEPGGGGGSLFVHVQLRLQHSRRSRGELASCGR